MPEGDVVLRAARRLTAALVGGPITHCELRWPSLGGADLTGTRSLGTVSVGKNLLTRFDDGRTLHSHFRMEGTWRIEATARVPGRMVRAHDVRAVVGTAEWTCIGRSLGMMNLVRTRDESRLVGHLGPDVLSADYGDADRAEIERRARAHGDRAIGAALLDQQILAGLGTIFMAETLFRHGVSPWRPTSQVVDVTALADTARRLMLASAGPPGAPGSPGPWEVQDPPRAPGSSGVPGGRGAFRQFVYLRGGRRCLRCTDDIGVGMVGEAPTARRVFFCPTCQAR